MKPWYATLITENIYGLIANLALFAGGIGSALVFPLVLGPEEFGTFRFVFSLANLWLFFANLGLDQTVVKFLSAGRVAGNAQHYLDWFTQKKLLLTVVSVAVLLVFAAPIATFALGNPALTPGVRVSAVYVFFYALYTYLNSVFVSIRKNSIVTGAALIYNLLRIVLPLAFVQMVYGHTALITGIALAALLAVGYYLLFFHRLSLSREDTALDKDGIKTYMIYGSFTYLGILLAYWMSSFILGVFEDPVDVGYYGLAFMWVSAVGVVSPFTANVLFSFYAEKHEEKNKTQEESIFVHSLRYGMVFAVFAVVAIVLLADAFVDIIYGPAYLPAATIFIILSLVSFELVLSQVSLPLLQGVGRIKNATSYIVLNGLLSAVFNVVAVIPYGIIGVAVSTAFVRLGMAIGLTIYTKKLLSVTVTGREHIRPLMCGVITFLVAYPLRFFADSLTGMIIYAMGILGIYVLALFASKTIVWTDVRRLRTA